MSPTTGWAGGADRTLTLQASDTTGNTTGPQSWSWDVDDTPPQVDQVTPALEIAPWSQIMIRFSEDMDASSLVFGGDMGTVVIDSWTTARQVILEPLGEWNVGVDRLLTVEATDLSGYPLDVGTYNHTFNVRFTTTADSSLDDVGKRSSLALSPDGNSVWVSYFNDTADEVNVVRSDDGGRTWNTQVAVDHTNGSNSIAVADDTVFLIYDGDGNPDSYSDLMFARSDDAGDTFPASDITIAHAGSRPADPCSSATTTRPTETWRSPGVATTRRPGPTSRWTRQATWAAARPSPSPRTATASTSPTTTWVTRP